jgi:hypothetical protein
MSQNREVSATPCINAATRTILADGVAETLLHETAGNNHSVMGI